MQSEWKSADSRIVWFLCAIFLFIYLYISFFWKFVVHACSTEIWLAACLASGEGACVGSKWPSCVSVSGTAWGGKQFRFSENKSASAASSHSCHHLALPRVSLSLSLSATSRISIEWVPSVDAGQGEPQIALIEWMTFHEYFAGSHSSGQIEFHSPTSTHFPCAAFAAVLFLRKLHNASAVFHICRNPQINS